MSICPYCVATDYYTLCQCTLTNSICTEMWRCPREKRWKPYETMQECSKRKGATTMPEGSKKVRFCKNGILFIEIEDYVVEIKNIYDTVPEFVYVVKQGGMWVLKDSVKEEVKTTKRKK